MIKKLIAYIGAFSPIFLFFISLLLLRKYTVYLSFYAIGTIINTILNITLKSIIQEPRPNEDYKLVTISTSNGHRFGPDVYGMPSGHAQNAAFNLAFITGLFKSPAITSFYLVITIITLGQRYIYKNHTILQLLVGFIIGTIIGTLCYIKANEKIKGHITEKPDDNGPL
jgi:membrane-associated phospholipid phosphatase